jgi:hypothetical protein
MSSTPMMAPRHVGQRFDVVRWRLMQEAQNWLCMHGITTCSAAQPAPFSVR